MECGSVNGDLLVSPKIFFEPPPAILRARKSLRPPHMINIVPKPTIPAKSTVVSPKPISNTVLSKVILPKPALPLKPTPPMIPAKSTVVFPKPTSNTVLSKVILPKPVLPLKPTPPMIPAKSTVVFPKPTSNTVLSKVILPKPALPLKPTPPMIPAKSTVVFPKPTSNTVLSKVILPKPVLPLKPTPPMIPAKSTVVFPKPTSNTVLSKVILPKPVLQLKPTPPMIPAKSTVVLPKPTSNVLLSKVISSKPTPPPKLTPPMVIWEDASRKVEQSTPDVNIFESLGLMFARTYKIAESIEKKPSVTDESCIGAKSPDHQNDNGDFETELVDIGHKVVVEPLAETLQKTKMKSVEESFSAENVQDSNNTGNSMEKNDEFCDKTKSSEPMSSGTIETESLENGPSCDGSTIQPLTETLQQTSSKSTEKSFSTESVKDATNFEDKKNDEFCDQIDSLEPKSEQTIPPSTSDSCKICAAQSMSSIELSSHIWYHLFAHQISCSKCDYKTAEKSSMQKHVKERCIGAKLIETLHKEKTSRYFSFFVDVHESDDLDASEFADIATGMDEVPDDSNIELNVMDMRKPQESRDEKKQNMKKSKNRQITKRRRSARKNLASKDEVLFCKICKKRVYHDSVTSHAWYHMKRKRFSCSNCRFSINISHMTDLKNIHIPNTCPGAHVVDNRLEHNTGFMQIRNICFPTVHQRIFMAQNQNNPKSNNRKISTKKNTIRKTHSNATPAPNSTFSNFTLITRSATAAQMNGQGCRALSPPTPRMKGHINAEFHARSKSATINNHQSSYKVASGTLMRSKLRNAKTSGEKIEKNHLNKATDYVLRHRETDPKTGDFRTSLKEYPCHLCQYVASHATNLKRHHNSCHSNSTEKVYQCDDCPCKYKRRDVLCVHVRSKHIVKQFHICTDCQYKMTTKANLNRHISDKHTKIKVSCPSCSKSIPKHNWKRHIRRCRKGFKDGVEMGTPSNVNA